MGLASTGRSGGGLGEAGDRRAAHQTPRTNAPRSPATRGFARFAFIAISFLARYHPHRALVHTDRLLRSRLIGFSPTSLHPQSFGFSHPSPRPPSLRCLGPLPIMFHEGHWVEEHFVHCSLQPSFTNYRLREDRLIDGTIHILKTGVPGIVHVPLNQFSPLAATTEGKCLDASTSHHPRFSGLATGKQPSRFVPPVFRARTSDEKAQRRILVAGQDPHHFG